MRIAGLPVERYNGRLYARQFCRWELSIVWEALCHPQSTCVIAVLHCNAGHLTSRMVQSLAMCSHVMMLTWRSLSTCMRSGMELTCQDRFDAQVV